MRVWSERDAGAGFDEFFGDCLVDGPQVVARDGEEVAVLVSLSEWERLQSVAKPNLKELLLSDEARVDDFPLPERGKGRHRKIPELKQSLLEEAEAEVSNPLMAMLGANKENRVFASSTEADAFIAELRNEWN